MLDSPDEKALIQSVIDEWNKAEKAIKIAEQVNSEIINPAIYELRYGGRRIVEAIYCAQNGYTAKVSKLLSDAHFDCCRARHDAIDAATTKISEDLATAVKKIGPRVVLDKFPDYTKLVRELSVIRALVANSREDRNNRDKIYETVAEDNIVTIVRYYSEFQANEELIKSAGRWGRFYKVSSFFAWAIVVIISAAALFKK